MKVVSIASLLLVMAIVAAVLRPNREEKPAPAMQNGDPMQNKTMPWN
jgi:hypothetical protein